MSIVSRIQNIILRRRIENHQKTRTELIFENFKEHEKREFLENEQ